MDCAAAPGGTDARSVRLENLVACSLLKYCDFVRDTRGENFRLWYFRDREKREVDFVVTKDQKPYWCIEVKASDDYLSPSLGYLHERIKPSHGSFQLVGEEIRDRELKGIKIVSASEWLDKLQ